MYYIDVDAGACKDSSDGDSGSSSRGLEPRAPFALCTYRLFVIYAFSSCTHNGIIWIHIEIWCVVLRSVLFCCVYIR